MATAGKKSKKHKGKTIPLTDFLADGTPDPGPGKVIRSTAWADEVESEEGGNSSGGPNVQTVVLPTAPREVHTEDVSKTVPWKPPFKAYIANLHYETNEEDIAELFANMKIVDLQLAREGNGRLKGYGHVEFETRDNLLAAIAMTELQVRGRWMRISVSSHADVERFDRRHCRRYEPRLHDPGRSQDDWRSGPRQQIPLRPNNVASYGVKDRGTFTRYSMQNTPQRDNISRSYMNVPQNRGAYPRYSNRNRNTYDDHSENRPTGGYFDRGLNYENRYRNQSRSYEGAGQAGNYVNPNQQRRYGGKGNIQIDPEGAREQQWNYGNQRSPPRTDKSSRMTLSLGEEQGEKETKKLVPDTAVTYGEWSVSTPASSVSSEWHSGPFSISDSSTQDEEVGETLRKTSNRQELDAVQTDGSDTMGKNTSDLVQILEKVTIQDTDTTSNIAAKGSEASEGENWQGDDDVGPSGVLPPTGERCDSVKVEELVMQHLREEPEQRRSSIFGGARPVDTTAREREVEARLERERDDMERRLTSNKERRRQHRPSLGGGVLSNTPTIVPVVKQPVKKIELSVPPTENVWLRRAALMAAKKEKDQCLGMIMEKPELP